MRITFNTGRTYTPEGQIIIAEHEGSAVLFRDVSRCVSGRIDLIEGFDPVSFSTRDLKEFVMAQYDAGAYTPDMRADQL